MSKDAITRHSPSTGPASPDVWGIYEPDTGSIQYICACPNTKKAALIDVVLNFDPKSARTSTESAKKVLELVKQHGLELVRMLATLLGPKTFKKGMDLYFKRHDGEATTIENFLKCFAQAGKIALGAVPACLAISRAGFWT